MRRIESWSDTTTRRIYVRLAYLGWTLGDLADALGVVISTVGAYTGGRRSWEPDNDVQAMSMIERTAQVLGVPVASLRPGGSVLALVRSHEGAAWAADVNKHLTA